MDVTTTTISPRFPLVRFLTKLSSFLLLDAISSLILWLVDEDNQQFMDGIKRFHLTTSVFDLAVIALCKSFLLIGLFAALEKHALRQPQIEQRRSTRRGLLLFSVFALNVGNLVFVVVKDVFVLREYKVNAHAMLETHYALCISSFAFAVIEPILSIWFIRHLARQKTLYAILASKAENGEEAKPKDKVNVGRLMQLAKEERWLIFFGTLGLLVSSGSQMVAPIYFGLIVQAAGHGTAQDLVRQTVILFLIYVAGGVAVFFRTWLYTLAGQRLVARLRNLIFTKIINQEIAFFDTSRTGELMNRLSSDSQVVQNALSVNISMLVRYTVQITGSVVIMFVVSPKLTAVLLAVIPVVGIGAQRYGSYVRDQQKIFQDELAKSASSAEETISSIRTVRSFGQEKKSANLYAQDIQKSYEAGKKLSFASGLFNMGIAILTQGAIVLVLWYGGKLVQDGHMNIGEMTSFILYALNIAMAFAFLSSLYGDFMKAVGASIRIFDLIDRTSELTPGTTTLESAKVNVEFDDVHFFYPTRPETNVLQGINFDIAPGETVALVGPSGGGKSTIINLIERFYDPTQGSVRLGGNALHSLLPDWLHSRVGIVSQEPILFATSITDNIAYARDASRTEVEEAARQANAHDFIMKFEEGYDTAVGERGIKLSGGQKQRVAIARALLMNPDILLLDEATSALDAESEALVQEAIDRAMVGRTVLVIAHRLSTVRNANKVLVLDGGRVVEQGTHDELLQIDGVYKRLVLKQLEAGSTGNENGCANADVKEAPDSAKPQLSRQITV